MGIIEPLALVANAESTDYVSVGPALEGGWRDAIVLGYLGTGHKGIDALLKEPTVLGLNVEIATSWT